MSASIDLIRRAFGFLEKKPYGFRFVKAEDECRYCYVTYANVERGVGVKILDERWHVFVFIYRLVDGAFVDGPVSGDAAITCFDIDYAIPAQRRMPDVQADHSPYAHQRYGALRYLKARAEQLKFYGRRYLAGDFSRLPSIERRIRRAMREP